MTDRIPEDDEILSPFPGERLDAAALVAGSFDPVTLGHIYLVRKAAEGFSRVYVTVFVNAEKKCLFTRAERLSLLRTACADIPGVTVDAWEGLLAEYARGKGIRYVVKGYRDENDLAYERLQARVNHGYCPTLRTVLLPAGDAGREISSTAVRARLAEGKSLAGLVPPALEQRIPEMYKKKKNSKI